MSNDNNPRPYTVTLTAIIISTPEEMKTADHSDLYWLMSGGDGGNEHIQETIQEWTAPGAAPGASPSRSEGGDQ